MVNHKQHSLISETLQCTWRGHSFFSLANFQPCISNDVFCWVLLDLWNSLLTIWDSFRNYPGGKSINLKLILAIFVFRSLSFSDPVPKFWVCSLFGTWVLLYLLWDWEPSVSHLWETLLDTRTLPSGDLTSSGHSDIKRLDWLIINTQNVVKEESLSLMRSNVQTEQFSSKHRLCNKAWLLTN